MQRRTEHSGGREGSVILVLRRSDGQKIVIGTGPRAIVITAMGSSGGVQSIGIEAPKDVKILRMELIGRPPEKRQEPEQPPFIPPLTYPPARDDFDDTDIDEPDF